MTTQRTRDQLNAVVKALAARDRSGAVEILARYNVMTTPQLKSEDVPAVYQACVEALKKLDANTP